MEITIMEKWKMKRNYRQVRDNNGQVLAYIITVDDTDVEVTKQVFSAYAQEDRRERYITEEKEPEQHLSLELFLENGTLFAMQGFELPPSAEDEVIRQENRRLLQNALHKLNDDEAELIQSLFFEGLSERQLSAQTGVHHMTIHNRKVRILRKLKNYMNE